MTDRQQQTRTVMSWRNSSMIIGRVVNMTGPVGLPRRSLPPEPNPSCPLVPVPHVQIQLGETHNRRGGRTENIVSAKSYPHGIEQQ